MSPHYNALIVVVSITMLVFFLAKPIFTRFIGAEDYARRRNIWLGLVVAAFLIPNYWFFVLAATVLLAYGLAKDSNPAALYMFLLMAIPPFASDIPTFGLIRQVFPLDHLRLMSLVVLLPVALRTAGGAITRQGSNHHVPGSHGGFRWADVLILAFVALQVILYMPRVSVTDSIRRTVVLGIDVLLPYFVLSRSCRTRREIVEVMASFALAATALACLAVFETLKSWLLFASLEEVWGSITTTGFLRRGSSLRAQVTAGHSIVLGYAFATAMGAWLYLQSKVAERRWRWLVLLVLVAGMAAALARGPWLGAIVMVLIYTSIGPSALKRTLLAITVLSGAIGGIILSPWGTEFVDRLPFIGTSDQEGSVVYRQQLAETSWLLIQQNPFFGNLSVGDSMEGLRQGEGIIDVVNAYAYIALIYGLVGLSLFVGFFAIILSKCFRTIRRCVTVDPDNSLLGCGLFASTVGGLVIIATVGLYLGIDYLVWAIAGLTAAYAEIGNTHSTKLRKQYII